MRMLLILAASLGLSAGAQAQTAQPAPSTPVKTVDATADQITAWLADDASESDVKGVAPAQSLASPVRDRGVHGEAGVSIGSGGYRSAYAVATTPLGEKADLTVAVANEHLGGGNRGWGPGFGPGPGDRRSFGLALNLHPGSDSSCEAGARRDPFAMGLRSDLASRCGPADPATGGR